MGLRARIESERGGWVDMVADQLRSAGIPDVVVIDEAYGRVLRSTGPIGDPVVADERSRDLYGYTWHRAEPDERLRVMPVRFTDPQGPYGAFLDQFGLTRQGTGDEYFAIHAGDSDSGQVGLHYTFDGELPIPPGPAAVHLTFETSEALDEVRDRLREAGYADAEISRDEFVALVRVTGGANAVLGSRMDVGRLHRRCRRPRDRNPARDGDDERPELRRGRGGLVVALARSDDLRRRPGA
jgi:hypothetical protein